MNELQKKELDILKAFIAICKKNNLQYYAYGGTLIGAVRHKGFIPWDDDIDVLMPRKDYDRFIEIANQELPENMVIRTCDSFPTYNFLFSKIHDLNTTYIGKFESEFVDRISGVFIDVFPLDGIPKNPQKRKKHLKRCIYYLTMNDLIRPHHKRNNSFRQKIIFVLRKLLQTLFKFNFFSKKIEKLVKTVSYENSLEVMDVSSLSSGCYKYIFKREWFDESIELEFENILINAPSKYDLFLKQMYGDYMIIPPIDQRDRHGVILADIDKPFSYYQNKIRNGEKIY